MHDTSPAVLGSPWLLMYSFPLSDTALLEKLLSTFPDFSPHKSCRRRLYRWVTQVRSKDELWQRSTSRSVVESSLPSSRISPHAGGEHTHQGLWVLLPTGSDEGFCPKAGATSTNKVATHPAFAGTSLKSHPLPFGAPNLFQDAQNDLIFYQ